MINPNIRAVKKYIADVAELRNSGRAREHAYRACLEILINELIAGAKAINEGERGDGGNPDFRVEWHSQAALGHIETKDINADLMQVEKSAQIKRYLANFTNFILTDYLEFRHYVKGRLSTTVRLCEFENDTIKLPVREETILQFCEFVQVFAAYGNSGIGESPSAEELAKALALKTRELQKCAAISMHQNNSNLQSLYAAFCESLMKGLSPDEFADIFAQTAVYGLFAARLESEQTEQSAKFSRATAGSFLPQTTPFLRQFFNQFMRDDLDKPVADAADNIADYLSKIDMETTRKSFVRGNLNEDPFLHFYETFLKHYNPELRKLRGVYYTPDAAVDFIVRAVDDSLRNFFGLSGLADNRRIQHQDGVYHEVQILDPAAGTGAFLVKILQLIKAQIGDKINWEDYALEHLLPRLHGFEYMMSAYSVCHLKFALELGAAAVQKMRQDGGRVKVFLTDALDYGEHDYGKIGLGWLSDEAKEAEKVKTKTPVMAVLGNPPYSVSSQNKSAHIAELLAAYKKDLKEKKINLDDDYIKFIRNAENLIATNKRGIVAMITNNSFFDGVTHRRMRWHLLKTFNRIYILNLHGNSRIRECSPDGSTDENIFDIMQGVGIFIMIKTDDNNGNAKVFYEDCYGKRTAKNETLLSSNLRNIKWRKLSPVAPYFFFTPKDFSLQKEYECGVLLTDLFPVYNSGIQTKCDNLSVHFEQESLEAVINDFISLDIRDLKEKYSNKKDTSGWNFKDAKDDIMNQNFIYTDFCYRPFDTRRIPYTGTSGGFLGRSRHRVMKHIIGHDNVALLTSRIIPPNQPFSHALLTNNIADIHAVGGQTYVFPLYCYDSMHGKIEKHVNINADFAAQIAVAAGLQYATENKAKTASPDDILNYVYAVLYNPHYRTRYAEFLKINFARIPLPKDKKHFTQTAKIGASLRRLHLLQDDSLDGGKIKYIGDDNEVVKISSAPQGENYMRVNINTTTAFEYVPKTAWEFGIDGYLPAQRWLKDRKGRKLNSNDQRHYRRLVNTLTQTAAVVKKMKAE